MLPTITCSFWWMRSSYRMRFLFAISVEAYSTPIFQLKHLIHNPAGLELMLTFPNLQKYGNTLVKNYSCNIAESFDNAYAAVKDINIVNVTGQVVKALTTSARSVVIPINDVPVGVYLLKTSANNKNVTQRFIKDLILRRIKMYKIHKYNKLLLFIAIAGLFAVKATAQGSLPGDPDTGVPLDGGLSIAIVAGVSYGAKRLMKKKKNTLG